MNFKHLESEKKLRGCYYTRLDIARYLSKWILESNPRQILEPSCGEGVFFKALQDEGIRKHTKVTGIEIDAEAASKARKLYKNGLKSTLTVYNNDFLDWYLKSRSKNNPAFDAIIGNPPFIRYQYLAPESQTKAEKIFSLHNLPFTKHTNSWVTFILASLSLLNEGGRLAMVIPAEIFHVIHASSLRQYLTEQSKYIYIIDLQEMLFDSVLQGAVLLLIEKKDKSMQFEGLSAYPARDLSFITKDVDSLFNKRVRVKGDALQGKWMKALLGNRQRELLEQIANSNNITKFSDIASVDVGIVTGANKFFLVDDETVKQYGLEKYSYPMFGRSNHVDGVIYDTNQHRKNQIKGYPTNFLYFNGAKKEELPRKIQKYLDIGEKEGIHLRYKCRIRRTWFSVPSVYATPVSMLKRCHEYPRMILNRMEAYTTDTAYRVKPHTISNSKLVFSFVNSLTALSAELEGRHYGGGVLELVPSEIERLLIPVANGDVRSNLKSLHAHIADGASAESIFEKQDRILLGSIGLNKNEQGEILDAWKLLKLRRHRL